MFHLSNGYPFLLGNLKASVIAKAQGQVGLCFCYTYICLGNAIRSPPLIGDPFPWLGISRRGVKHIICDLVIIGTTIGIPILAAKATISKE